MYTENWCSSSWPDPRRLEELARERSAELSILSKSHPLLGTSDFPTSAPPWRCVASCGMFDSIKMTLAPLSEKMKQLRRFL